MNTFTTTYMWRRKYRLSSLDTLLRAALVAEKICVVDRTGGKYIDSPYSSQSTVVTQAIVGTYVPAVYTLTDELLTVNTEFIVSEHVYNFEETLLAFDIMANRLDDQDNRVKTAIDSFVLNALCEAGTGTYSTPSGGFTTTANVIEILSNLLSKVAGYSEIFNGTYLVIEASDIPGFIQAQAANGFNMADATLRNGFMSQYMGIDIYVVQSGTFVNTTYPGANAGGTLTVTNDGHRVFGVKNVSTYAAPRSIQYEEKQVTGKTGKEIVTFGYIGFKAWFPKRALTVDVTLTA